METVLMSAAPPAVVMLALVLVSAAFKVFEAAAAEVKLAVEAVS